MSNSVNNVYELFTNEGHLSLDERHHQCSACGGFRSGMVAKGPLCSARIRPSILVLPVTALARLLAPALMDNQITSFQCKWQRPLLPILVEKNRECKWSAWRKSMQYKRCDNGQFDSFILARSMEPAGLAQPKQVHGAHPPLLHLSVCKCPRASFLPSGMVLMAPLFITWSKLPHPPINPWLCQPKFFPFIAHISSISDESSRCSSCRPWNQRPFA